MNGETDMRALNRDGAAATDLSGRVAIVTGAAQGQGAAEARHFRDLGATVIMVDISDGPGEAVSSKIGATYRHTDVSSAPAWEELIAAVVPLSTSRPSPVCGAFSNTAPTAPRNGPSAD
jgi:NAD(P)-dependent dehydrogenase (short-subunit alcohol dehydrogenase family)